MASLTIQLSDKDLNLLKRISESDDRRINDFVQLMFSRGLDYYYCDEMVSIKKTEEEYTQEERDQQSLNAELMNKYSTHDERKEHGFKYVYCCISNHEKDDCSGGYKDMLIEPIVNRIKSYAIQ